MPGRTWWSGARGQHNGRTWLGFELAVKRSSSSSNVITFHCPGIGTETSAHADSAVRQMPLHEGRWQKKNHKQVPLYTDYDGPLWRRGLKACTLRLGCTFCRWCMNAHGRRGVGHTFEHFKRVTSPGAEFKSNPLITASAAWSPTLDSVLLCEHFALCPNKV